MATDRYRANKEPTKVSLVYDYLRVCDDFATMAQIATALAPAVTANHVRASLHHLRKHGAAECLDSGGLLWWYATPQLDSRSRQVEVRTPEAKPRKPRRGGQKLRRLGPPHKV